MWQKCPVCNGSGASQFALYMTSGLCSACHGHGIINELTGAPMPDPVSIDPPKFTKISDEQKKREIADILKRTNDLLPKGTSAGYGNSIDEGGVYVQKNDLPNT